MANFDILILSNGPGEITTWVLPIVQEINDNLATKYEQIRVSLVLSPCPNATGNEHKIASQWNGINRVQSAKDFFPFLLWGKTADNWDWADNGLVIFLGGDQFFTVVVARRLGYKSLVYGEWDVRWYRYIDYFAVKDQSIVDKLPSKFRSKCTVVGDLMMDITTNKKEEIDPFSTSLKDINHHDNSHFTVGLLPGSKASKLAQGVPFFSAIAHYLYQKNPNINFIIPVAPTINPEILASYGQEKINSLVKIFGNIQEELIIENNQYYLKLKNNLTIKLITKFPCYEELKKCDICLTTVGANTAQLGSLGVPMIILLPIYQLDAMKSWDGLLGLLVNLPLIGGNFAKLVNWLLVQYTIKNNKLYGWPNIIAKKEIVPEYIGYLTVKDIGNKVLEYIEHPHKLQEIKNDLSEFMGAGNTSQKIIKIIDKIVGSYV